GGDFGDGAVGDCERAGDSRATAVAGGLDQSQLQRKMQPPDQIREKDEAAGEDTEHRQRPAAVFRRELFGQPVDPGTDLRFGKNNFHVSTPLRRSNTPSSDHSDTITSYAKYTVENRRRERHRMNSLLARLRRAIIALTALGAACHDLAGATRADDAPAKPKRVAAVVSEYRHNSHADVIVSRLFQTYTLDGKGERPGMQLMSVFTDQVPESDTSRKWAREYNFRISDTVADALTLGTGELAVDGVLLVAEHGKYPVSETGQT